jgi:hypothetical protein
MSDGLSQGLQELQESLSGATDAPDEVPSEDAQPEDAQVETIDSVTDVEPVAEPDQPEGGWNPTDRTEPSPDSPVDVDPGGAPLAVAHEPLPIDHPHASDIGDWPTPEELPEPDLDLAGLSQADFEEAIFPDEDESDHAAGQKTLARVEANLKSAGYATDEPWRTQIAAALWGRRTYEHGSVSDVRRRIERAPVAEIIACMPDHGDDVVTRMRAEIKAEMAAEAAAAEEIRAAESFESGGRTGMTVVAIASVMALGLPLLFARRS